MFLRVQWSVKWLKLTFYWEKLRAAGLRRRPNKTAWAVIRFHKVTRRIIVKPRESSTKKARSINVTAWHTYRFPVESLLCCPLRLAEHILYALFKLFNVFRILMLVLINALIEIIASIGARIEREWVVDGGFLRLLETNGCHPSLSIRLGTRELLF